MADTQTGWREWVYICMPGLYQEKHIIYMLKCIYMHSCSPMDNRMHAHGLMVLTVSDEVDISRFQAWHTHTPYKGDVLT